MIIITCIYNYLALYTSPPQHQHDYDIYVDHPTHYDHTHGEIAPLQLQPYFPNTMTIGTSSYKGLGSSIAK